MTDPTLLKATMAIQATQTFPFVSLPAGAGRLPVEVCLVACLSPGSGNKLFYEVLARQRAHSAFVDELDEPSAKLGGTSLELGDATALYSFGVGSKGHPFHRHAGHRIFSAISGSAGAQLRFSTATPDDIVNNPSSFIDKLRCINIPPDCLFTVRFGGETWHQFMPLRPHSSHPVFFALSCHTNELGGALSDEMYQAVARNEASIPSLTELLPESVASLLSQGTLDWSRVPTTALFLDKAPHSLMHRVCGHIRALLGALCGTFARHRRPTGFVADASLSARVRRQALPAASLLQAHPANRTIHHEDCVTLTLPANAIDHEPRNAEQLLAELLEGFLHNPPGGVTRLMQLRNKLVKPLKLRVSPLGCPVSSLLADQPCARFASKYPVLAQQVQSRHAQVILGADDRHLVFRSCVAVQQLGNGDIEFSLSTRVSYHNLFGRFYMSAISMVHQQYVAPAMLTHAVEYLMHNQKTCCVEPPPTSTPQQI